MRFLQIAMKHLSLFLLSLVFIGSSFGAPPSKEEAALIKKDINRMLEETKAFKADFILQKTHPALGKFMGGEENLKEMTAEVMIQLKEAGLEIVSFKVGEPGDLFAVGKEHFCFVPKDGVMNFGDAKLESKSYMIAIRGADGKTWTYLDGAGFNDDPKQIFELFPEFPKDKKLPEQSMKRL